MAQSEEQYWRVKNLLERGMVRLEKKTATSLYFKVGKYDVTKTPNGWNCTCEHGSMWRFANNNHCCHIRAAKEWLRGGGL